MAAPGRLLGFDEPLGGLLRGNPERFFLDARKRPFSSEN
jgi:hypothetical protein